MAGPGGRLPRRSHTKSRSGCRTCKKRHIRCDEGFPQCRNCIKHNCRCPYLNSIASFSQDESITSNMADLMWTPEIEADIARWKVTGIFPFLNLCACPPSIPARFSYGDLRLFYHVASISSELDHYNASHFTLWTWKVPLFLSIAVVYPYVMHALLALAATHLAWLTNCPLTANMAYRHRGAAMESLHEAVSVFCRKNSDAVLAASLLLSWQESNWCGWTHLMHGTSSIIIAMQHWKNESKFGDFIAEQSAFPTVPLSSISCTRIERVQWKDLDALERACVQLQKVENYLETKDVVLQQSIRQLIEFIKKVRSVAPYRTTPQRFEMLDPLRIWLFWRPVAILQTNRDSPPALITLAHLYAVALLIEPFFPKVGAAYFGSLSMGPVDRIEHILFYEIHNPSKDFDSEVLYLMRYPIDMVARFRHRMLSRPEVTPLPTIYNYNPIAFERLSTWMTPYSYHSPVIYDSREPIPEVPTKTFFDQTAFSNSPTDYSWYYGLHLDEY